MSEGVSPTIQKILDERLSTIARQSAEIAELKTKNSVYQFSSKTISNTQVQEARISHLTKEIASRNSEIETKTERIHKLMVAADNRDSLIRELVDFAKLNNCPDCDGSGVIVSKGYDRRYVTRDMALDACDPSLEGTLYTEEQHQQEQCQWCFLKKSALAKAERVTGGK